MAKILKTSEQEAALEAINSNVKVLKGVNRFLEVMKAEDGSTVTFVTGKAKASVPFETADVRKILQDYRKNTVQTVRNLSRKYVIGLDEDDEAVLSADFDQKKPTKKEKAVTAEVQAQEENAPAGEEKQEEVRDGDDAIFGGFFGGND